MLATAAPVVVVLKVAYDAELVQSEDFASQAAVDQGHEVALVVIAAAVVAALLRLAAAPLDTRLATHASCRGSARARSRVARCWRWSWPRWRSRRPAHPTTSRASTTASSMART